MNPGVRNMPAPKPPGPPRPPKPPGPPGPRWPPFGSMASHCCAVHFRWIVQILEVWNNSADLVGGAAGAADKRLTKANGKKTEPARNRVEDVLGLIFM